MAAALVAAGYPVGLTDVDAAGLEAVRARLAGDGSDAEVVGVVADAVEPGAPGRVVGEVTDALGPVGVLVNALGTFGPRVPFAEADEAAWWRVLEVDLRAPAGFLRAVLPQMASLGCGHVVNLVSRTAVWDDPAGPSSAYATAKAALARLGQAIAAEAPQGVVVVGLSPGLVRSAMTAERPGYDDLPDVAFVPVEATVDAVLAIVAGDHDDLHGRLVHATDDLVALSAAVAADPSARRLGITPAGPDDPFT